MFDAEIIKCGSSINSILLTSPGDAYSESIINFLIEI